MLESRNVFVMNTFCKGGWEGIFAAMPSASAINILLKFLEEL